MNTKEDILKIAERNVLTNGQIYTYLYNNTTKSMDREIGLLFKEIKIKSPLHLQLTRPVSQKLQDP
jgi:hypothetical protein